ncbi:MAG TPA: chloride channel protein [Acetobacteraceae bacterium]|nr:chloride channel protein [Acetobacteraceae bacterium]
MSPPPDSVRRATLLAPREWMRRLVFWTGAVIVALVAILFAQAASLAERLFHGVLAVNPLLVLLLAPSGFAFAVFLTRRVFPGAQGSGIPQTIAALEMTQPQAIARVLSLRVAFGKMLLCVTGLACGASIGREGPSVQIGASIMRALGDALRVPGPDTQRALVLAGGAAGIAAAFNTPLAGIVFAIEELSRSFEQRTSGIVITAVVLAGITTLALLGNYTYFGVTSVTLPVGSGWIAVLVCGVLGGLGGGAFSQTLVAASRGLPGRAGRFVARRPVVIAALCGLAIALIGLASGGSSYGTGYAEAHALVAGQSDTPVRFFVLKALATIVSYCSGIPGGIFAPSLAVGAGLGRVIAHVLPAAPAGAVVLLGMVAYFSGVVQAPLTAAVIVMEMTDNQQMTIPLMAAAFLGFAASRLVCPRPLYDALAHGFRSAQEGGTQGD